MRQHYGKTTTLSRITCQKNGKWSKQQSFCVRYCSTSPDFNAEKMNMMLHGHQLSGCTAARSSSRVYKMGTRCRYFFKICFLFALMCFVFLCFFQISFFPFWNMGLLYHLHSMNTNWIKYLFIVFVLHSYYTHYSYYIQYFIKKNKFPQSYVYPVYIQWFTDFEFIKILLSWSIREVFSL